MRLTRLVPATVILAATLLWGSARLAQASGKDGLVLAIVNGEPITRGQLVVRLLEQRGELTLDKMIGRLVLQQGAEKRGITVSTEEVDQKLKAIQDRLGSEDHYHTFLKRSGLTEEQHREEIRNTLLLEKVTRKELPIADSELELTDAHIIVTPNKELTEKWIKELEGGVEFVTMAGRNEDPNLRQAAGHLQPFLKIEMLTVWQAIEDQKLKPGQYTKTPVELGPARWAIIRLDRRIPVEINGSAAARDRLLTLVTEYHGQKWLEQARQAATITRAASMTKTPGELVVATVNGQQITREQLASRLLSFSGQEALEQMVNRTLLLQAAKQQAVTVSEEETGRLFDEARSHVTPEQFQALLTGANLTERQLRDEIRYRTLQERVALKESPVTDADLNQYTARILEVPTHEDAEEMIKELGAGEDFAKLVQLYSVVDQAKAVGGLTKRFLKTEMLDIWRAIRDQMLAPGAYTKTPVLLGNNDYVIVKLESIRPGSGLSPVDRKKLTAQVTEYRSEEWLAQARARAKCTYPTTLSASTLGDSK